VAVGAPVDTAAGTRAVIADQQPLHRAATGQTQLHDRPRHVRPRPARRTPDDLNQTRAIPTANNGCSRSATIGALTGGGEWPASVSTGAGEPGS
jgi:hypothetical protein